MKLKKGDYVLVYGHVQGYSGGYIDMYEYPYLRGTFARVTNIIDIEDEIEVKPAPKLISYKSEFFIVHPKQCEKVNKKRKAVKAHGASSKIKK